MILGGPQSLKKVKEAVGKSIFKDRFINNHLEFRKYKLFKTLSRLP